MKYLSLFSGIGGFEIAIHNVFKEANPTGHTKDAVCVGYSELDKFAIQVYEHHFPTHKNLGNVTEITEWVIKELVEECGGIDLVVGGFPCQNLTSIARSNKRCNSDGLSGPKSGLFWNMINILTWIQKYQENKLNILIENNASMTNDNKQIITDTLKNIINNNIYITPLNGSDFGVQTRRRLYWTTWNVDICNITCTQKWDDVLFPIEECYNDLLSDTLVMNTDNKIYPNSNDKNAIIAIKRSETTWSMSETNILGRSRRQRYGGNSTINLKCSVPVLTVRNSASALLDYRINTDNQCLIRYIQPVEVERLFYIPDGWVSDICSKTRCQKLLGNTVIVKVIEYILQQMENK